VVVRIAFGLLDVVIFKEEVKAADMPVAES
jgi:hypothetical protein